MSKASIALLCIATVLCCAACAWGAVPSTLSYQGKLMQPSGAPVPDGTYSMVFSVYSVTTGGTALWTETNTSVQVKGGLFSALLGSINPLPSELFSGADRWFGVKVGEESEMSPRQKITSVAYAQVSGNGVPVGGIITWSGSVGSIPSGWALCDGSSGTPDLRDRFVVGAGSSYAVGATGGAATVNLAHSHTVSSHTHSVSAEAPGTNSTGAHTHSTANNTHRHNVYGDCNGNYGGGCNNAANGAAGHGETGDTTHNHGSTGSAGGHSHTVNSHSHGGVTGSAGPGTDSQLSSTAENRPPYYALCFIMKLAN